MCNKCARAPWLSWPACGANSCCLSLGWFQRLHGSGADAASGGAPPPGAPLNHGRDASPKFTEGRISLPSKVDLGNLISAPTNRPTPLLTIGHGTAQLAPA